MAELFLERYRSLMARNASLMRLPRDYVPIGGFYLEDHPEKPSGFYLGGGGARPGIIDGHQFGSRADHRLRFLHFPVDTLSVAAGEAPGGPPSVVWATLDEIAPVLGFTPSILDQTPLGKGRYAVCGPLADHDVERLRKLDYTTTMLTHLMVAPTFLITSWLEFSSRGSRSGRGGRGRRGRSATVATMALYELLGIAYMMCRHLPTGRQWLVTAQSTDNFFQRGGLDTPPYVQPLYPPERILVPRAVEDSPAGLAYVIIGTVLGVPYNRVLATEDCLFPHWELDTNLASVPFRLAATL